MIIKVQPRQSGKTHDLIEELKKDKDAIVIVAYMQCKDLFLKKGIPGNQVFAITQHNLSQLLTGRKPSVIHFDELGMCIEAMFPSKKLGIATHTNC